MDKLERLLNLTAALLSTSRPLSAAELRERLGKSAYSDNKAAFRRTFERDKADLRAIGVPLEVSTLRGSDPPVEGYRIPAAQYSGRDPALRSRRVGRPAPGPPAWCGSRAAPAEP